LGKHFVLVVRVAEVQVEVRLAEAVALDRNDTQSELLTTRVRELRQLERLQAGSQAPDEDDGTLAGLAFVDVVARPPVPRQRVYDS
jgi:hypothetical protein